MPTDPWLWDTSPVPASRPAIPVQVARYDPTQAAGSQFQILDNIECVEIAQDIGIDPGRAVFRYVFDGLDPDAPQSVEQALTSGIFIDKQVLVDDKLCVKATMPGGTSEFLFYGTALIFEMHLEEGREEVRIVAIGWAKVLWNSTMPGARIRDADNVMTGQDYDSDVPAQFNPKGQPNATIEGAEAANFALGAGDYKYPTFVDPLVIRDPDVRRPWTLALAARYLIYRHSTTTDKVTLPTGDELDPLLVAREPIPGADYDPDDSTTFTVKDIIVTDSPLTGRDWPGKLNEMIRDRGFAMCFDVGTDDDGVTPTTTLRMFLLQGGDERSVYLQARGSNFDPELSNLGSASVSRDVNQVVNQWEVVGALERYEASFILACGFPMAPADGESLATIAAYDKNAPDFKAYSDAYRLFVMDETGEGHYAAGSNTVIEEAGSMDDILGPVDGAGKPTHATRRRRPIGELISADANGKPYRARLSISTNYTPDGPGIWDGTGTWQDVDGQWELVKDRLGIRVTADNPNKWRIGQSNEAGAPYPAGVVKVVESLSPAAANEANPRFKLRLTCVIEGDTAVSGTAQKTTSSILTQAIARQIDARDRFQKNTVCESSPYNTSGDDEVDRDDSDNATAEATAHRAASEAGILEGQIEIPRLTRYYKLGDRITEIDGRDMSLRTDSGDVANTNAAIYPVVVGIRHLLKDGQRTILHLSDQDGHRHRIERKIRKG